MTKTTEPLAKTRPATEQPAVQHATGRRGGQDTVSPLSTVESAKTLQAQTKRRSPGAAPTAPPQTRPLGNLETAWRERGIDIETVRVDRKGTVVSDAETSRKAYAGAPRPQDLTALPTLRLGGKGEANHPEFELGDILGTGGMGVVKVATQTTLEREVAIKTLRPELNDESASPQLMLEARVTGTLEHPNVVPIHAVGRDESGLPLIVMKRIEGRSWEDLIAELGESDDGPSEDLLQRHLNILVQVAQALHFAHSRGVLHRDLKPANVMIGGFGEVYVVDWGIAVALGKRGPVGLQRAKEVDSLAGTPAYMAPEMAAGDGGSLSARTDVYLLGATLHELITGHAPHEAGSMLAVVRKAFASEPHDYGPDVPQDLVDICHRSMHWNPAERYADAGEFAAAVEAFLIHRSSTALSDEAAQRLPEFRQGLAEIDIDDRQQMRALRSAFSEIRFAFAQARKTWSENRRAAEGLQECLELMIEFELQTGAAGAAAALVDELPESRPELAARVEHAVAEQRATRARLEKLERDADLSIGDRARKIIAPTASLAWCTCCVVVGVLRRHDIYPVSQLQFGLVCAAFGAMLGLIVYIGRRTLYANIATGRIAQTTLMIFGSYTVLWSLAYVLGVDLLSTTAIAMLLGGMLWASLALHVQRAFAGMAAAHGLALVALLQWPGYPFEWLGLGGVLGGVLTAWAQHRAGAEDVAS